MQVQFQYIEDDKGRLAVLPTGERLERSVAFAKKSGLDTDAYVKNQEDLLKAARDSGSLKELVVDIKPYTYGQKIEAARVSTTVSQGEFRLDQSRMNLELIMASTGMDRAAVENLSPLMAQAIFEEIQFASEPDPDRLLFLLESPTAGEVKGHKKTK